MQKNGRQTPQAPTVYQRRREPSCCARAANTIYGARPNADCQRKGNAHQHTPRHENVLFMRLADRREKPLNIAHTSCEPVHKLESYYA